MWLFGKQKAQAMVDRLGWFILGGGDVTACLIPLCGEAHLLSLKGVMCCLNGE